MKNQIVKIDASEYGLEESKAKTISDMFKPMLDKMVELENESNSILSQEISEELCIKAKELRLRYVKIRTRTAEIHKGLKQFYLQGGRFVDGWKNAQSMASQGVEEKLMSIEKHFENIEKERIKKLQETRSLELQALDVEFIPDSIGGLGDDVWRNYLTGQKVAFEAKKEAKRKAEEERIEIEKVQNLKSDREILLRPYYNFLPSDYPNLGMLSTSEWNDFFQEMKNAKSNHDKEQIRIKEENEKLRIEAEAKELKAEKDRIVRELKEKKEREENQKLIDAANEKLRIEQAEKQRIINELAKQKEDELKAEKIAKLAPDKDKINAIANDLALLIRLPECKSDEAKKCVDEIRIELKKVHDFIIQKSKNL